MLVVGLVPRTVSVLQTLLSQLFPFESGTICSDRVWQISFVCRPVNICPVSGMQSAGSVCRRPDVVGSDSRKRFHRFRKLASCGRDSLVGKHILVRPDR